MRNSSRQSARCGYAGKSRTFNIRNPLLFIISSPERIAKRDKLILSGLFLSKYDASAFQKPGFNGFVEAFNVIGYALGAKPASIKNYRDEFDPLCANRRKGWHKRPMRPCCSKVYEQAKTLDLESFAALVRAFVGYDENQWSELRPDGQDDDNDSSFARRVTTGLAAEHYFESVQSKLPEFKDYSLENTTRLGCGYDFRLQRDRDNGFLAVEVKGLTERSGCVSLTPKEHEVATTLADRFYLFVVKNFKDSPFHDIYRNPISGELRFAKKERVVVQVSWLVAV